MPPKAAKPENYNLEAILAVGFRVKSPRGTQFRRWANTQPLLDDPGSVSHEATAAYGGKLA